LIAINFKKGLDLSKKYDYFMSFRPIKNFKAKNYFIFDLKEKEILDFSAKKGKKITKDRLESILTSAIIDFKSFFRFLYHYSYNGYNYFRFKGSFRARGSMGRISYDDWKFFFTDLKINTLQSINKFIDITYNKRKNLENFDYIVLAIFTFGYILLIWWIEQLKKIKTLENRKLKVAIVDIAENFKDLNVLNKKAKKFLSYIYPIAFIYSPLIFYIKQKFRFSDMEKAFSLCKYEEDKILCAINVILNTLNTSDVYYLTSYLISNTCKL